MHTEEKRAGVSAVVAALPSMTKAELVEQWEQTFSAPPSARLRRELMIPLLAYRIQETAYGGLSHAARARLRALVLQRPVRESGVTTQPGSALPASTARLLRSWRGEVHEVLVTAEGYVYRGELFQRLSPIARRITGVQWSGPAFFGTRQQGRA